MQISERFSKTVDVDGFKPSQSTIFQLIGKSESIPHLNADTYPNLKSSQMIAMLALPDAAERIVINKAAG